MSHSHQVQCSPHRIAIYRAGCPDALLIQTALPGRRPYIHPILAPDGDGEMTEDEPAHHVWQRGLFVGLNGVSGWGFWKEGRSGDPHDGSFHPEPLVPPEVLGDTVSWSVFTDYRTPEGETLMKEGLNWRLSDRGELLQLDAEWSLTASSELAFEQYPYGGLFLRMPWRRETHGSVLTSEGAESNAAAEGKRARWVALAMPLPGRSEGLAGFGFFDHPTNPGFPNAWRVDDNLGLGPSRSIMGSWRLAEGERVKSRYRLVAFTGEIRGTIMEEEWRRFAAV